MNAEAHIEENLAIAREARPNSLTEDELRLVQEAGHKYRELMKVPCTGCGYCMPCPSDVAIPRCFEVYNKMHMFGNAVEAKFSYALSMGGVFSGIPAFASQCVRCEECLEKCPQHIEIPDFLEMVAGEMEDDALEKRIVIGKKMLNAMGYNVLLARGGKEALKICDEFGDRIDTIVLDMIMPDMSGGETFDRLKNLHPNIKVVLASGYNIDGQAREILDRGCDGFIQKPFDMKKLTRAIREVLDQSAED